MKSSDLLTGKDLSDQLAEAGNIVVAPDLLSGKGRTADARCMAEGKAMERYAR